MSSLSLFSMLPRKHNTTNKDVRQRDKDFLISFQYVLSPGRRCTKTNNRFLCFFSTRGDALGPGPALGPAHLGSLGSGSIRVCGLWLATKEGQISRQSGFSISFFNPRPRRSKVGEHIEDWGTTIGLGNK